ncbi:hypothetical protein MVT30_26445, partial [Salmonella sp. 15E51]
EQGQEGEARTIVIGKRGMTDMSGKQHISVGGAFVQVFTIGEMTVGLFGVNQDFVLAVRERKKSIMACTQTPLLTVV